MSGFGKAPKRTALLNSRASTTCRVTAQLGYVPSEAAPTPLDFWQRDERLGERGGVVDAVAHHRDLASLFF